MSNHKIIDSIVTQSAVELFAAYDHPLRVLGAPVPLTEEDDVLFASVIGFTGPWMRGTLMLAPSRLSVTFSSEDPALMRDWVGELANQLLGRIKNMLLARGAEIYATTPAVIRGHQLAAVPRGDLVPFVFDADPGRVWVYFDAELQPNLALREPEHVVPAEGETILF